MDRRAVLSNGASGLDEGGQAVPHGAVDLVKGPSPFVTHCTTRNGSRQSLALGQRLRTTSWIHAAASELTSRMRLLRSGPRNSTNVFSVSSSRPGLAHSSRPESRSTTTVR